MAEPANQVILGIDTGGTFTDFVMYRDQGIVIHKVLSTPENPSVAILQGVHELLGDDFADIDLVIVHGSTVATNAALERKGVKTVYVANKGFKDLLTIGRQARKELYNLQPEVEQPPVPDALCVEVNCRRDAAGELVVALTDKEITALQDKVAALKPEAIAINLLFSYVNDDEERCLENALKSQCFVSRSSFVLPEYKEYERGMATWLNAWLGPLVERYLSSLAEKLGNTPVSVMQSSGGTISLDQAAQRAVNLMLSGPAGGLAAARFIGAAAGCSRLMTFDMGGTSSDVALIDGAIQLTNEGSIGPYPVAVPMVDMHTIGAGGGSIVWIDEGGMLQVGPQSAGAVPGPACYGKGGMQATVTDANLILGRLLPEAFLGGAMHLDVSAAKVALQSIADAMGVSLLEAAEGVIALANEHMARALRTISVQRGYNPAEFVLCAFGGAGGLHVCALAEAMDISSAIVPVHGGVLSALGMVVAPRERQFTHTLNVFLQKLTSAEMVTYCDELIRRGVTELVHEGARNDEIKLKLSLDCRYIGQSFTLNLSVYESFAKGWSEGIAGFDLSCLSDRFHKLHKDRYGHRMPLAVELVNIRVSTYTEAIEISLPSVNNNADSVRDTCLTDPGSGVLQRDTMQQGNDYFGPLLVTDAVSTIYVSPDWRVQRDAFNNLLLNRLREPQVNE